MSAAGVIFYLFGSFLAGVFTEDLEIIDLVARVLKILALVQPFTCITLVITSALQGAGDTKFPMYSTLVGIWGVRVLGVYILGLKLGYGLVGVWLAASIDLVLRGIVLMIRFIRGSWKEINIG